MAETKQRDYTKSAVNLCNPPELAPLLTDLARLNHRAATLQAELEKTQIYTELTARQKDITDCRQSIQKAIEAHGSYQDLDTGTYAVKQRKLTITYAVSKVREFIRTYAEAVIDESVNKTKLEGLRKGGLVDQADLDRCADTTETFAFLIKVPETQPQQETKEDK